MKGKSLRLRTAVAVKPTSTSIIYAYIPKDLKNKIDPGALGESLVRKSLN